MIQAIIKRDYKNDRTLGEMTVFDNGVEVLRLFTLERSWEDNERMVSCIPEGEYTVEPNETEKYPGTYRVLNVEGRSGILFHAGNYPWHSSGCILTGLKSEDIDGDGVLDIARSRKAVRTLRATIGDTNFNLIIK